MCRIQIIFVIKVGQDNNDNQLEKRIIFYIMVLEPTVCNYFVPRFSLGVAVV